MTTPPESQTLPSVETTLSPDEVKSRLTKLSKKGKLAGFEPSEPSALCSVAAHGAPFDSKMLIRHDGDTLEFECVLLPMMPRIFVLLLIVTVWPGLPLTEGFLVSFDWYTGLMSKIGIDTWHWYLPLTILPAPFAYLGAIKKSKQSAHKSALEAIEKVQSVL